VFFKLSLCCSFILSTLSFSAFADTLDNILGSEGLLGDAARQVWTSNQSSGRMGGITPKLSEGECYEELDDLYHSWFSDIRIGEIYSVFYSHETLSSKNIEGELDLNPSKDYFYGLTSSRGLKVGSYSPETAVHLKSGCEDYLTLGNSIIKDVEMRYPVFKKGKRSKEVNLATKECRVTKASIGDLSYEIIACPGDDSVYTRYLD
jgi:hypothetical protein